MSRSADSVDAPASVDLPQTTSVASAHWWRSHLFTGEWRFSRGVDLRAAYGVEVAAASRGTLICADSSGSYGNLVVVRDSQAIEPRYAHLSATLVWQGDHIAPRTPVGPVGPSGRSAALHLHFEMLVVNAERIDSARSVGRGRERTIDVR